MATATLPEPAATETVPDETRSLGNLLLALTPGRAVALTDSDWAEYEYLLKLRDDHRRGVRIWYDRGRLEIVSTTSMHEWWKTVIGSLVEGLADELDRGYSGLGGVTISSQDKDRGLEPDECYYVQSVALVTPMRLLDFAHDPPPDLAIEIEYSRTVVGRLGVYAAFRIPEVWRYNGTDLTILHLQTDGTYQPAAASRAFPELPPAEFVRFLRLAETLNQREIVRQFRAWVREHLVPPEGRS